MGNAYREASSYSIAATVEGSVIKSAINLGFSKNSPPMSPWRERLAARHHGNGDAPRKIGAGHAQGKGVPTDADLAVKRYPLAADHDLADAQYDLACLHLLGLGIAQDDVEAAALLHGAAGQGHIDACRVLGYMYADGSGVERSIPMAAEFFVIAALEGDADASNALAGRYGEIEKEGQQGSLLATLCLAKMYDRGLGVKRSKPKKFAWLSWGARCGTLPNELDVREELDDMWAFFSVTLSDPDKRKALALLDRMVKKTRGARESVQKQTVIIDRTAQDEGAGFNLPLGPWDP